ncbi:hypothetical protein [Azospirillum canadense]|uniref:hypothetical protein n=1 Tax=Azospirillum canadense TaxID=403962 RepID=UPI0022269ABD|nr:hypothetical protein [Azospirillum canadense]MCW2244151.1 hypothetical protein [Azospirillum canadense]
MGFEMTDASSAIDHIRSSSRRLVRELGFMEGAFAGTAIHVLDAVLLGQVRGLEGRMGWKASSVRHAGRLDH